MLYIFVEQPINDMVITVPAFFNQAERRAMLRAGEMAGVNVLQLINDNSAGQINILNLFFLYIHVQYLKYNMINFIVIQEIFLKHHISLSLNYFQIKINLLNPF